MKIANRQKRALHEKRLVRFASLISRYPHVNDDEVAEIIRYLRNPPGFDIERLRSREDLRSSLADFTRDHRDAIKPAVGGYMALALLLVALLTVAVAWFAAQST